MNQRDPGPLTTVFVDGFTFVARPKPTNTCFGCAGMEEANYPACSNIRSAVRLRFPAARSLCETIIWVPDTPTERGLIAVGHYDEAA